MEKDPQALLNIFRILEKPSEDRSESEKRLLSTYTSSLPFFYKYIYNGLKNIPVECASVLKPLFMKKGEVVFQINSEGTRFYTLIRGEVGLYTKKSEETKTNGESSTQAARREAAALAQRETLANNTNNTNPISSLNVLNGLGLAKILSDGDSFGELGLLSYKLRSATAICLQDCYFAIIEKDNFDLLLKKIEQDVLQDRIDSFVNDNPVMKFSSKHSVKALFFSAIFKRFSSNEQIFHTGDPLQAMYIIKSGQFEVLKEYLDEVDEEDEDIADKDTAQGNSNTTSTTNKSQLQITKSRKKYIPVLELGVQQMFGYEDFVLKGTSYSYGVTCKEQGELIIIGAVELKKYLLSDKLTASFLSQQMAQQSKYIQERQQLITQSFQGYSQYYFEWQKQKEETRDMSRMLDNSTGLKLGSVRARSLEEKSQLEKLKLSGLTKKKMSHYNDALSVEFQFNLQKNYLNKFGANEVEKLRTHVPQELIQVISKRAKFKPPPPTLKNPPKISHSVLDYLFKNKNINNGNSTIQQRILQGYSNPMSIAQATLVTRPSSSFHNQQGSSTFLSYSQQSFQKSQLNIEAYQLEQQLQEYQNAINNRQIVHSAAVNEKNVVKSNLIQINNKNQENEELQQQQQQSNGQLNIQDTNTNINNNPQNASLNININTSSNGGISSTNIGLSPSRNQDNNNNQNKQSRLFSNEALSEQVQQSPVFSERIGLARTSPNNNNNNNNNITIIKQFHNIYAQTPNSNKKRAKSSVSLKTSLQRRSASLRFNNYFNNSNQTNNENNNNMNNNNNNNNNNSTSIVTINLPNQADPTVSITPADTHPNSLGNSPSGSLPVYVNTTNPTQSSPLISNIQAKSNTNSYYYQSLSPDHATHNNNNNYLNRINNSYHHQSTLYSPSSSNKNHRYILTTTDSSSPERASILQFPRQQQSHGYLQSPAEYSSDQVINLRNSIKQQLLQQQLMLKQEQQLHQQAQQLQQQQQQDIHGVQQIKSEEHITLEPCLHESNQAVQQEKQQQYEQQLQQKVSFHSNGNTNRSVVINENYHHQARLHSSYISHQNSSNTCNHSQQQLQTPQQSLDVSPRGIIDQTNTHNPNLQNCNTQSAGYGRKLTLQEKKIYYKFQQLGNGTMPSNNTSNTHRKNLSASTFTSGNGLVNCSPVNNNNGNCSINLTSQPALMIGQLPISALQNNHNNCFSPQQRIKYNVPDMSVDFTHPSRKISAYSNVPAQPVKQQEQQQQLLSAKPAHFLKRLLDRKASDTTLMQQKTTTQTLGATFFKNSYN